MATFPWSQHWPEITDPRVRAAFAAVPRTAFVPPRLRKWAERDAPLPIGEGQTISQPFVVALMTQALDLHPGDRVLEIGAGSGYQTAILCELTAQPGAEPGESVFSIERYSSLARRAGAALRSLGYRPHLRIGDGAEGWPEEAPFDAILLTAAPAWLPRPLWDQLAGGGRLVAPVGPEPEDQMLWRLIKHAGAGRTECASLGPVRFVPLISPVLNDPAMRMELPCTS